MKGCGALRPVLKEALEPRDGVLGFACGDDRNARLRDICGFHERLQEGIREIPKSFLFTWPGGPLALSPCSPLVGPLISERFRDEAFLTIRRMMKVGGFTSLILHGHYPCLAAQYTIGEQSLFQVLNLFFDAKTYSKKILGSTIIKAWCQFDFEEQGKIRSYDLDRENWDIAYPTIKPLYV